MASDTHGRDIQVGLVGTGYIADWHAKALDTIHGVKLAAVCDKDLARAQAFASRRPGVRAHDSLEAMLDDSQPELDAVHVLVPPDLHASVAASLSCPCPAGSPG